MRNYGVAHRWGRRLMAGVLTAAVVGLVPVASAGPANAVAAGEVTGTALPASLTDGAVYVRVAPQPSGRSAASYGAERYGYQGVFRDGTAILDVNWYSMNWLESFGIAPDRSIWHAWPGSGRWWEMPGGGRADYVYAAIGYDDGSRVLVVYVVGSGPFWCSMDPATGQWSGWWNCS